MKAYKPCSGVDVALSTVVSMIRKWQLQIVEWRFRGIRGNSEEAKSPKNPEIGIKVHHSAISKDQCNTVLEDGTKEAIT